MAADEASDDDCEQQSAPPATRDAFGAGVTAEGTSDPATSDELAAEKCRADAAEEKAAEQEQRAETAELELLSAEDKALGGISDDFADRQARIEALEEELAVAHADIAALQDRCVGIEEELVQTEAALEEEAAKSDAANEAHKALRTKYEPAPEDVDDIEFLYVKMDADFGSFSKKRFVAAFGPLCGVEGHDLQVLCASEGSTIVCVRIKKADAAQAGYRAAIAAFRANDAGMIALGAEEVRPGTSYDIKRPGKRVKRSPEDDTLSSDYDDGEYTSAAHKETLAKLAEETSRANAAEDKASTLGEELERALVDRSGAVGIKDDDLEAHLEECLQDLDDQHLEITSLNAQLAAAKIEVDERDCDISVLHGEIDGLHADLDELRREHQDLNEYISDVLQLIQGVARRDCEFISQAMPLVNEGGGGSDAVTNLSSQHPNDGGHHNQSSAMSSPRTARTDATTNNKLMDGVRMRLAEILSVIPRTKLDSRRRPNNNTSNQPTPRQQLHPHDVVLAPPTPRTTTSALQPPPPLPAVPEEVGAGSSSTTNSGAQSTVISPRPYPPQDDEGLVEDDHPEELTPLITWREVLDTARSISTRRSSPRFGGNNNANTKTTNKKRGSPNHHNIAVAGAILKSQGSTSSSTHHQHNTTTTTNPVQSLTTRVLTQHNLQILIKKSRSRSKTQLQPNNNNSAGPNKEEGDQLGDEEDFVFGEPEEGLNNDIHRRRSHRRSVDDKNGEDDEYNEEYEEYAEEVPFFTPVEELEDILLDRFDVVFSALDNLETYKQVSSDRLRDCYKVINDLEAYAMVLGRDLKEAESLSEAQKYSIKKLEGDIDLLMDEITTCSNVDHHHLGEEVDAQSGDNYVVASNRRSNNSIDGTKLATAINDAVETGRHEDAGVEGGSQDDVAAPSNGARFDTPDATHPPHTHPSSITDGDATTAAALPQRRSSLSSVHSTSSAQGSRVPSRRKHDRSPSAHTRSRSHSPYVLPPPSNTGDVPTRRPTPAASQTGFRTSAERLDTQVGVGQVAMSPVARGPSSHAKKEKKSRTATPSAPSADDLGGSATSAAGEHNPLRHKSSSRQAKRGGNKRGGGFIRDDTPTGDATEEKRAKKEKKASIRRLLSQIDQDDDDMDILGEVALLTSSSAPAHHPTSATTATAMTMTAAPLRAESSSSSSSVDEDALHHGSRVPSNMHHKSGSRSRSHSPYILPPSSNTGDVPTRRPTPAASQTGFRTSAEPQAEFGQVVMSPVARGPSSHAKKKKSRTTPPSDLGGSTASAHGDQDPHNPLRHKSSSRQAKRGGNKRGGGFIRDDTPIEEKKVKKEKKSRVLGGDESSPQRHRHSSIQHLLSQLDDEDDFNDNDDEHTFPSSSAAATSPRAVVSVQADDGSHARIAALEAEIRRQIGLHEVVATTLTRYEGSNNQLSLDNEHLLQECAALGQERDALEDDLEAANTDIDKLAIELEAADETERRLKQKIVKLEDKLKRYKLRHSSSTSGMQSPSSSTPSPRQPNNDIVQMDGRGGGGNAAAPTTITTTTDISYERRSSTTTTTTTRMARVSAAASSTAHHATDDDGSAPYKPPQSQDDDNDQHDTEEGGVEEEEEVEDGLVDTPPFGNSDNEDDGNHGNGGGGGLSSSYRHPKPPRACSN